MIIPYIVDNFGHITNAFVRENREFLNKVFMKDSNLPTDSEFHEDINVAVPFTSRLMAYYRAQETKNDQPLIVDPFAERLAGDMTNYVNEHKFFTDSASSASHYSIIRAYYVENNLLASWCKTQSQSQIVLLGAGLDSRAYRFSPLQINSHTIFEVDFPVVNAYKAKILHYDNPLCTLKRVDADLSSPEWATFLLKEGFSSTIPTFWVLEGLIYYLEKNNALSLLQKISNLSHASTHLFFDLCVPGVASLYFGPFTKHFKWGLAKHDVPMHVLSLGWEVITAEYANLYDHGRDVGQQAHFFVHAKKATTFSPKPQITAQSDDWKTVMLQINGTMTLAHQDFARDFASHIIPEVSKIVTEFTNNPQAGTFAYIAFTRKELPALIKIAQSLRNHLSLGQINPRLRQSPLSIESNTEKSSNEEKEAFIAGYLKAILQLVYCVAQGLEGWQFMDTILYKESQKSQRVTKITNIPPLLDILKQIL